MSAVDILKRVGWILAFPFILVYYSIRQILWPCIVETFEQACEGCCFQTLSTLCGCICGDFRHTDDYFKPNGTSLVGGENGLENDPKIKWVRASEIATSNAVVAEGDVELGVADKPTKTVKAHLFDGKIEPSDIAQGQLGDCWLLSAIATLAEKKGMIERIFVEKTHSVWSRYTLKMYIAKTKSFRRVIIDDFIPTKDGEPIFTKPNGNEMWVLLLEKAFAKLVGGYGKLEGGMPLWAMEVMTGDHVAHWTLRDNMWQKQELVHQETDTDKRKAGLRDVGEKKPIKEFFAILETYESQDAAMAAYSLGNDDKQNSNGIVKGHAYSILAVKKVSGGLMGTTRHFFQVILFIYLLSCSVVFLTRCFLILCCTIQLKYANRYLSLQNANICHESSYAIRGAPSPGKVTGAIKVLSGRSIRTSKRL
jgi:hypothetical protein